MNQRQKPRSTATASTATSGSSGHLGFASHQTTPSPRHQSLPAKPRNQTLHATSSTVFVDNTNFHSTPGALGYRQMQQSFISAPSSIRPSSRRASSATVDDSQATTLNSPEEFHDEEAQAQPHYQNNENGEEGIDDSDSIGSIVADTQQYASVASIQMQSANPPEWENISLNVIIKRLKAISPDTISSLKMRDYYKLYPTWDKMTQD